MAEQKTEETKPAVPRRAARPFVGPAGAAPAGRPVLRPAGSGDRPRPAAFAAPVVAERAPLGMAPPPPARAALPAALPAAPGAEVPVLPTPDDAMLLGEAAGAMSDFAPTLDVAASTNPLEDATDGSELPRAAVSPMEALETMPPSIVPSRPVTSEMVAVDAYDAFDALWGVPDAADVLAAEAAASPSDGPSLGGGADAQQQWDDEIAAAQALQSQAPSAQDDDVVATADSADTSWAASRSEAGMPSWLADDARPVEAPASSADALAPALDQHVDQHVDQAPALASSPGDRAVEPMDPSPVTSEKASSDAQWPDPLLAEYAPYIPTPLQLRANAETPLAEGEIEPVGAAAESTDGSLAERPDVAAVDDMPALVEHEEASFAAETAPVMHAWFEQSTAPAIDAMADSSGKDARGTYACGDSGARVSATLDRLAERVRSGEIDVSSIAAEAPDAAVLASVLAALLGGSGSR